MFIHNYIAIGRYSMNTLIWGGNNIAVKPVKSQILLQLIIFCCI